MEVFTKRFLTVLNPMNTNEKKKEDSEEGEGERVQDNKTLLANFKVYIENMNKNLEELASLEDNEDAKTEDTNVKLGKKNMRIALGGEEDKV